MAGQPGQLGRRTSVASADGLESVAVTMSPPEVDDVASGDGSSDDTVEYGLEAVEADVVADLVQARRLEIGAEPLPHLPPAIDRCLHRVDAEQRDASEDERQHGGGQVAAARQPAGGHGAAVADPLQHVGEGRPSDA